jgi:fructose-specific phosphotransferase system IIC component
MNSTTKRFLISAVSGVVLLVVFIGITWCLSHNFPAEGADTSAARKAALTYSWIFPIAHSLDLDGLPATAFILGVPAAAYSLCIFALTSFVARLRGRNTHLQDTPPTQTL